MQQQKAQDQVTNLSLQLKDLNLQIHYTGQYLRNKKTYTAFFNSKNKGLYRKNHASEIQAYETARDWLKQNLSEETIPSLKKLYEKNPVCKSRWMSTKMYSLIVKVRYMNWMLSVKT